MPYHPSARTLERYGRVLVNFALGGGRGIRRGDVVYVRAYESAKPLYLELCRAVWRSGGHVIGDYRPDDITGESSLRDFFELASKAQLDHFPSRYMKGLVDEADHLVMVLSEADRSVLEGVDPKKVMAHKLSLKPWMDWRRDKERAGHQTWTLGLYGTAAMAEEVGLTERQYWQQIIRACLLDQEDPVKAWRETARQIKGYLSWLNRLQIKHLHVEGPDVDLRVSLGEQRMWAGGSGRNIPSFECFTSPDWRGTEGSIRFNQPLYYEGGRIEGIALKFRRGQVVDASATHNQGLLEQIVGAPNGDKVGEFSLTDSRLSRITRPMGVTLYDENRGGRQGNTHIALGQAYRDCFDGDQSRVRDAQWDRLGYNSSPVHVDIISTSRRRVTATLASGSKKVIYEDGRFLTGR